MQNPGRFARGFYFLTLLIVVGTLHTILFIPNFTRQNKMTVRI